MRHPSLPPPKRQRPTRRCYRGFTLVELMVAVTGGLFIALAVFALASDASRFYKRESRVADATLGGLVGFERLRADIGRAGFLATPNIRRDPRLCGNPIGDASFPQELQRLASLRIDTDGSPNNNTLNNNGITPDSIVLSGSYTGADEYPVWNIQNTGAVYNVFLQARTGALGRRDYMNLAAADHWRCCSRCSAPGAPRASSISREKSSLPPSLVCKAALSLRSP